MLQFVLYSVGITPVSKSLAKDIANATGKAVQVGTSSCHAYGWEEVDQVEVCGGEAGCATALPRLCIRSRIIKLRVYRNTRRLLKAKSRVNKAVLGILVGLGELASFLQ